MTFTTNPHKKRRIILHVDMDHFFSAIEERENPLYKGKPVVVGADPKSGKGRGVVKTCNYIARKFGIHSGMPFSRAWRLCPHAIYLPANYSLYKKASVKIMAILRKYSDKLRQWGFDEAFLDVSSKVKDFREAIEVAFNIKHEILWEERITCSIGIAPNKLVAKIASDYVKPDGLTVVREGEVRRFLAPLPVRRMLWIGEKTERKMNKMGINTLGDLASADVSLLVKKFGIMGLRYHQYAHGKYESEVGGRKRFRKSLGHESTFLVDVDDRNLILERLDQLCQRVIEKIARRNLLFKTVTVKVRHGNFKTHTSGKTLPFFTNRLKDLKKTVRELVRHHLNGNETIGLLGVRVSNLKPVMDRELFENHRLTQARQEIFSSLQVNTSVLRDESMPLTIEWDNGVSFECCGTKLIFDPQRKNKSCPRIFVTHAHYDHSKGFNFRDCEKVSTEETKEIVESYGKNISAWKPLQIGSRIKIDNIKVVSHNAGHVLGSTLYEVITPEGNIVYTGDLQYKDSFTLRGAEPVSCDILIVESSFGSESFRFPDRETVTQKMVQWTSKTIKSRKIPTFKTDSLGNAQEITKAFNSHSKLPVTVHPRVAQINQIYNANGHSLKFLNANSEEASEVASSGECVLITPKNTKLENHPELEPALVSGWALWTKKNKTAFPLSDHADFNQLMKFVEACKPRTVLTCFGGRFNHAFAKQVEKQLGIQARPLNLIPTKFEL